MSQLVTHLDIRRQMDAHCITLPLEERLHIMRLKDEEYLRPCLLKSLVTVEEMGIELTMRQYDLIFTEALKPGDAPVDVCNRIRRDCPTDFPGYPPSVSDVLVLQTRLGCHALYIDSVGFELMQKFVCPPEGLAGALTDPLYCQGK